MGKNQTMRTNSNLLAEMLTAKGIDNTRHDNSKYAEYCNAVYVGKHRILCWNHSNDVTLSYDKYIAKLVSNNKIISQEAQHDSNGKQFITHYADAKTTAEEMLQTAVVTIEYILEADAEIARAEEKAKKEAEKQTAKQKAKQKARAKQKATA